MKKIELKPLLLPGMIALLCSGAVLAWWTDKTKDWTMESANLEPRSGFTSEKRRNWGETISWFGTCRKYAGDDSFNADYPLFYRIPIDDFGSKRWLTVIECATEESDTTKLIYEMESGEPMPIFFLAPIDRVELTENDRLKFTQTSLIRGHIADLTDEHFAIADLDAFSPLFPSDCGIYSLYKREPSPPTLLEVRIKKSCGFLPGAANPSKWEIVYERTNRK